MLKIAVDESGSDQNASAICVVACWTTSTQWRHFAKEWAPYAAKYPQGFHASKASPEDNVALAGLINRRVQAGIATTIDYDDFKSVVPHTLKSRFGAEYSTAIQAIALVLKHFWDRHNIRWTGWVLEAGHAGEASAKEFLDRRVRDPAWHILSHTWVNKTAVITHAPDLVSHEIARCFGKDPSPLLRGLQQTIIHRHFSKAELVEAVRKGNEALRLTKRHQELSRASRKRRSRNK